MAMAMASRSTSSSVVTSLRRYDVFVSFRGEDTRYNFIDHLFAALERKGIYAFRDDTNLEKGDSIDPELRQSIQGSQIFVVVFSKNYASSTWCLRELRYILQCIPHCGKRVLPVFYDVDPSEVRSQKGIYGEDFAKHELKFQHDSQMVQRWREDLKYVANLSGWDLRNKPHNAEIEKIVEEILNILGNNVMSKNMMASLKYCLILEDAILHNQGLQLRPSVEVYFGGRARRVVLDTTELAECLPLSPQFASSLSAIATSSNNMFVESGLRFMHTVEEILEKLTSRLAILHFGGNVLSSILQLFDKYMDALLGALQGPSDDENLPELKEAVPLKAETVSEKLLILGIAFTILDDLLPNAVLSTWMLLKESKEPNSGLMENAGFNTNASVELKEWREHLHHSFKKLVDKFSQQYVLSFIYSREGKARMNAHIYVIDNEDDLYWDSGPLPSLPFMALFAKLQQLACVAGDVLLGIEKFQKILLARLTETVVMWLSDEQEFWGVLEDNSVSLLPLGLRQLILDMHFTVEIARFAGYPSRHVHHIASAIIARAIRTFSARGINPQSALPADEWFVETAKSAINKLLLTESESETSDTDEDHRISVHDEAVSDSDTVSSLSTLDSIESFASASMGELDSPSNLSDPDN